MQKVKKVLTSKRADLVIKVLLLAFAAFNILYSLLVNDMAVVRLLAIVGWVLVITWFLMAESWRNMADKWRGLANDMLEIWDESARKKGKG